MTGKFKQKIKMTMIHISCKFYLLSEMQRINYRVALSYDTM